MPWRCLRRRERSGTRRGNRKSLVWFGSSQTESKGSKSSRVWILGSGDGHAIHVILYWTWDLGGLPAK
jgi:hypothetical protein